MPIEIKYPDGNTVQVCERTFITTLHTFYRNGTLYEPESVKYFFDLVKKNDSSSRRNILDVGAQVGLYSLYAKYLPDYQFFSYEPNPITFPSLVENCNINDILNVTAVNKGLGDSISNMTLHVPLTASEMGLPTLGSTPKRFNEWNNITVDVTTIDNEFFDKDIPLHFIKVDTEGWEYYVIKGGLKTIEKWKPEIFLEVCSANQEQCGKTTEELLRLMSEIGYKNVSIHNDENYHFSYKIK